MFRSCYERENVNIVIDETDWGFRIGEVEVMVDSKAKVMEATKQIEQIAKELGKPNFNIILTLFYLL